MKPIVSKALNQMKLQVRRHNETYRTEIDDCRANPEKYEEEVRVTKKGSDDEDSDEDSDESDDDDDDSDKESQVILTPSRF